ncbi:hypothetical protein [Paraclostridium sordellii]|uniref:hypothetical protein n=1 Tax=Paraclostridium sordellii TaxID=1505 RepID=UPI000E518064|nr:hypothetical protein [Paeniclostridium sordellii]RGX10516.1 hypothetical protein DWV40_05995 [Paeniclostridium sordellii]
MCLEFKTKPDRRFPDIETQNLFSFIINHKNFLDITFAILSTYTKESKNIKFATLFHPIADKIENDPNLDDYIDLLEAFYSDKIKNGTDFIAYRRGDLLEMLGGIIAPLTYCKDYIVIPESLVYENGVKIAKKDIDIITNYNDANKIECIECKANINNYIGKPLDPDSIEKLNFMKLVRSKAKTYKKDCTLLFATYRDDIEYASSILMENSFNEFEILNAPELINRIERRCIS